MGEYNCESCKCVENRKHCRYPRRPDGVWTRDDIIGAKVKIASIPAMAFSGKVDFSRTYTLKDIEFRVSLDGKVVSLVKLEEFPDEPPLTLKDIEVISIMG